MSTQGLTLKAKAFDNSGQGTLSSQAELDVQAERLNNRDGGLILGTTRTDITSRDIDNTAGRLQSSGQMTSRGNAAGQPPGASPGQRQPQYQY